MGHNRAGAALGPQGLVRAPPSLQTATLPATLPCLCQGSGTAGSR